MVPMIEKMGRMIEAVLFDLDDTLLDGDEAWRSGVRALLTRCPQVPLQPGITAWDRAFELYFPRYLAGELTLAECRAVRMRTWAELVGVSLPAGAEHDWFDTYQAGYAAGWTLFPDARPCLDALAGVRLGLITNGDTEQQHAKVAALGLTETFAVVIASGDIGIAKPDPRIFKLAAERLGVPPERCAFIGDRQDTDAQAAAATGMTGIWLNRPGRLAGGGMTGADGMTSADVPQIVSLAELPALLHG